MSSSSPIRNASKNSIRDASAVDAAVRDAYLICAHAGLDPTVPIREQTENDLVWSDPRQMLHEWGGPRTLCVGHLPTFKVDRNMTGRPIFSDHTALVDTSAYATGVLTAIRFPDREVLQASLPTPP